MACDSWKGRDYMCIQCNRRKPVTHSTLFPFLDKFPFRDKLGQAALQSATADGVLDTGVKGVHSNALGMTADFFENPGTDIGGNLLWHDSNPLVLFREYLDQRNNISIGAICQLLRQ